MEKGEAAPGEILRVRVRLRPYRGAPRIEEATVHVPEQVARGTSLRVLISDAELFNRASRGFVFQGAGAPVGLDQLISLLNRERRNDCVYVGLFVPSPTILWDDKRSEERRVGKECRSRLSENQRYEQQAHVP